MRKLLATITVAMVMFCTFYGNVSGVAASNEGVGSAISSTQEADNVFTFKELGYSERIMVGPYDSSRILFSTPPTWQLTSGGSITLKYNLSYTGAALNGSVVGGALIVYFNNIILDTIILDQVGLTTVVIDIPLEALQPTTDDGRHFLNLFFDASINCDEEDVNSSLVVSAESSVDLQFVSVSPSVDLARFPEQIYQPNAMFSTAATIVVPNQPSALELQSALSVSASLGSISSGQLSINLIPVGQLTEGIRAANNLIFVGLPSSFSILKDVELPVPVINNKLSVAGATEDDGIIQLALSPWNPAGVIVFVSGNTETAVVKSGTVIGFDRIVSSARPDVAVVSDINPDKNEIPTAEIRTFADLGYGIKNLGDVGGQYISYNFSLSSEQASSTGAYLDLITSHSNLLKLDKTGVSIFLNGQVISSLQFESTIDQISTTRIEILPNILRRGKNILEVVSDLKPNNSCASQDLNGSWVTISEFSSIYVPITTDTLDLKVNSLDLKNFPILFLTNDNLSDVAFVFSKDDKSSWEIASQIANLLGDLGEVTLPNLRVSFGDKISEDILNTSSIILVGRASSLPIIAELNKFLPAPFVEGLDEAIQPTMLVNYRLLPGVSVGYVQVLPSPWNSDRSILAVMGNTDQGVPMAVKSLLSESQALTLAGNFAIVYGDQLISTDTRLGQTKDGLAGQLPSDLVSPEQLTPSPSDENVNDNPPQQNIVESRADWILPAILITTLFIVGIAFITIRREIKSRVVEKPDQDRN